ncbi:ABC transporter permease [Paenibacillus thalictri]|uniref:Iron ABC transporter permease n=1 Tax=Paenibacillus thalictri TaxID=2527873 RepID=A0A4Q9DX38_9BACL|nr:iron ABC transporter permease [Paenibacillus thalictri]TBL81674.1 iron ABC transporter permease [Paenibacillus thalictri]
MIGKPTELSNSNRPARKLDLSIGPHLVWWGTFALLGFTVFYPCLVLLINSFKADSGFTLSNYVLLFQTPAIYTSMFNSLKVVIPATCFATILGVLLAWIVARTKIPGKRVWQTLIATPYLIPPFVGAISWTYLLGPVGLINNLYMDWFHMTEPLIDIYSMGGMIFVMSIYGYTIPYIVVLPAIQKIDASVEEAGRISGASTLRTMKDITLPLITPAILGGMLLLFMNLLADFGIPSVLGAPKHITLMTSQIYQTIMNVDQPNHLQIASANSLLLAVIGLIGLQLYQKIIKSSKYMVVSGKHPSSEKMSLGKWTVPVYLFMLLVVIVTTVAPICAAIYTSLIKAIGAGTGWDNLTFRNYATLFKIESIKRALINSISLSAIAGFAIAVFGLILSYMVIRIRMKGSRIVEALVAIPYAVPGTIVGLAMILAFVNPLPIVGWQLYNTFWILLVAYLARFMNLGLQTITGAMTQIHPSLEEASRISGASQMRAFWDIMLPLLRPSFYAAFFLVMMPALGEITLSSLLWSVNNETIGVIVFAAQEEGKIALTAALAVILILFVVSLNMILKLVTKGKIGM